MTPTEPIATNVVVKSTGIGISISAELLNDPLAEVFREFERDMWEGISFGLNDMIQNGHIGPVHRPGRNELWELQRPERVRANIRRNVPGRPLGVFRRSA